jgi:hypothetical protein
MRRNVWILSKWELFVEQPEPIPPFFEVGCYLVGRQTIPEQCLTCSISWGIPGCGILEREKPVQGTNNKGEPSSISAMSFDLSRVSRMPNSSRVPSGIRTESIFHQSGYIGSLYILGS